MSKNAPVRILAIVASVRPVRRADAVLAWWLTATRAVVNSCGAVVEVADLRALRLPLDDEPEEPHTGHYASPHTRRWSRMVTDADAILVITSENNHSLPASLKNAFDHLSAEWRDKPVAWVGYGNTSTGTRAVLAGKQVATTLGLVSTGPDVCLRLADWTGDLLPDDAGRDRAARDAVARLVGLARILRPLRAVSLPIPHLPEDLSAATATAADAAELLVLQRCCWVDEAIANNTLAVPAFREGLEDVQRMITEREVVVVRRGGRMVASVQAWRDAKNWRVARLMVAPDQRRRGLARLLLQHVEARYPDGPERVVLSTGEHSLGNITLYESAGFAVVGSSIPGSVDLAKPIRREPAA
ncbi:MAG: NAD(P)H-dependent oxidoreductase [Propionibacteriaceae bacterium]|nr:NAD(P)H-dependent oxidoreductase [Propionibacteriaceae bacterium]